MSSLSKISVKRPVTTVMVLLMVLLGGILSYTNLPLSLMPTIDIPIAIVATTYVGAGPSEIEELVTKPVEEGLASISNVDKIQSISSANSSIAIVQFVDGTDIDMATMDIREKIDLVKTGLPDGADNPLVLKMDINAIPVYVGVTSENLDLQQLNSLLEDNVVNRLERIDGVSAVTLSGGDEQEIEITINPERLAGFNITPSQISQALKAENISMPSGQVSQGETKLQVRTVGEFTSVEEIRSLPISTPGGAVLHLSDIATVEEVNKERTSFTLVNGTPGVMIALDKQSTANIVEVSDKINKELAKITSDYPELNISMLTDTADYIKLSIGNVTSTAFQSAFIAVIVLFLFLRNPVTSLIIGVSIPTSIFAAFALMYVNGMSMNTISMGGITIGIGMLVDNSVVVLDNIFKYWERGYTAKESSELGAKEISMAVTASTLTTVAVFLPLAFVSGTVGQMFKDLSFSICFSLAASLVVSLTFVPMACSLLLNRTDAATVKPKSAFGKVLERWGVFFDSMDNGYRKILVWALRHRVRTTLIVVAVFIGSLVLSPLAGFSFMPDVDEGSAGISIEMPKGTRLEYTQEVVDEVLKRIENIPEIDLSFATVGSGMMSSGTDTASVSLLMVDLKDRTRSTKEICEEIKTLVADIPGTDITVSASNNAMGSYGGADITFNITGADNKTLLDVEKDVKKILANMGGLKDITSSAEETTPEATIYINRMKASQYGISASAIAGTLNTAVTGSVATQYKVDGDEIDVRIRYDEKNVNYINDIKNITVPSASGIPIPLTEISEIKIKESAASINRENQKKYITINAYTDGIDVTTAQQNIDAALSQYPFPEGYEYSYGGTTEQMMESFSSLFLALIVSILLIYMIMASQFESLLYPGIVMFSMPLAITGGILGLLVTGNTITVTAFMGFIMLVGMVVNNAIVLIDYTNQLVERGKTVNQALIYAGPSRLRPILMTTLTTIAGLMPMAIGSVEGMEMQKPLAIAVIFGLTLSTLVTLLFIPVVYSGINDLKKIVGKEGRMKRKLARQKDAHLPECSADVAKARAMSDKEDAADQSDSDTISQSKKNDEENINL